MDILRLAATSTEMKAYEEIVEFIAGAVDAGKLTRFRPSTTAEAHIAVLIEKNKEGTLRPTEREELHDFLRLST